MRTLTVISGPATGRAIEIEQELVIGREGADLTLEDEEMSRRHAAVRPVDDGVEVTDLGSLNGTFADERRLEGPTTLSEDAVLRLGTTRLELRIAIAPAPDPDATVLRQAPDPDATVLRQAPDPDLTAPRQRPPVAAPDVTAVRRRAPAPEAAEPAAAPGPPAATGPAAAPGPPAEAPKAGGTPLAVLIALGALLVALLVVLVLLLV